MRADPCFAYNCACLKLRVDAGGADGGRPAIAVIGGVLDVLVVEADVHGLSQGPVVIGLDDALGARMGQAAVADEDAGSAGVQIALVSAGDGVDHPAQADGVVGPLPARAVDRDAGGQGAVDVGELVGLDRAAGDAALGEDADAGRDLLLEIDVIGTVIGGELMLNKLDGAPSL